MKVLFSNPPWWDASTGEGCEQRFRFGVRAGSRWPFTMWGNSKPGRFVFGDYLPYPMFMGYAATYAARETGFDVRMRDSIALKESYETYFAHIAYESYDYIILESATPSWPVDREIIDTIHRLSPTTRIALAGPIAVAKGEEILNDCPVVACIKGEYEKGSVRVLLGEEGIIDYDLLSEDEMNAAPFPYYDATIAKRYWDSSPKGQTRPHAQVWSSRGCPYKCIFCVWPATMTSNDPDGTSRRRVRHYTADYMEAFLTELVEKYHYQSIYFDDDTFNLGDRHVLAMCDVMRKVGVPWSAMCRADTIKLDTWRAMKDSGCFGVKLGFESGSQYVIDHIVKKKLDLAEGRDVVHHLKALGMTVHGTFTFGLPGETPAQMEETRRFIASLPLDTYQLSGTAVIEGTPLDTLLRTGKLAAYDGANTDGFLRETDGNKKLEQIGAALAVAGA